MPDLTSLHENPLWNTACAFARCMHSFARSKKAGLPGTLRRRVAQAAVRLPATIAEVHGSQSGRAHDLHLMLANAHTIELEQALAEIRLRGLVEQSILAEAEEAARLLRLAFHDIAPQPHPNTAESA